MSGISPDIVGHANLSYIVQGYGGAMYATTKDVVNAGVSQVVGPYDRNIGFQASRHSALYGNSNTNQTNALRLLAILKF